MNVPSHPHVLGIDDGPFDKWRDLAAERPVPLVAVMMQGCDLVEAVATHRFPVDGEHATAFLADWIRGLRCWPQLHAVLLGGVTLAGLAVVNAPELASRLERPLIVVNRREPADDRLRRALQAAGLADRARLLEQQAPVHRSASGLFTRAYGIDAAAARLIVDRTRRKGRLPEPLRLAHLIAAAVATGESHGRA